MTMRHSMMTACLGLLLVAGQPAWAAPDADALAERLSSHAPQCATFEQTRWLADLEASLKSRGYFQREADGLSWHTLSPIQESLHLSEESDELPMSFQLILPVFTGLLAGDWQTLERHFTIVLEDERDGWRADLTPIDPALGEHLSQLVVQGGERVEQLDITFRDGDRLELSLTPVDCASLDDGNAAQ
ncbi:LolA family protein [Halomonas kalidii]|uniref:Outer membrane lipoprotein carrier protein LolA n=1 Tax=Halomonas kalidii TaxID=3043293 RepID=A0ABT6VPD8_9GAMM|nr:hypothetical protein [Halomonas kalidii]MDI5934611.1 hypothetical protein [Halomonas kalidii]